MGNTFGFEVEKDAEPLLLHELCRISPDLRSWYAKCGVVISSGDLVHHAAKPTTGSANKQEKPSKKKRIDSGIISNGDAEESRQQKEEEWLQVPGDLPVI